MPGLIQKSGYIKPGNGGGHYAEYIATRETMEEINGHTGPVWTFVYSLKREDAHRLGYENSESWRKLLLAPHPHDGLVGGPKARISNRKGHRKNALPAVQ